ncbi:fimbria/pilus periplasmic chaperone [Burkholderia sp. Tr-20390]|uniref:fimbrial biogenesis chaperone n=1 Tax=Burkholderia sp. Tr-20390 TaxID=2703904 RepID=UPI00198045CE|nr:fimbria/pilus periplasmic chaperone [Burkholderia sp. Tr-20390]MBN3734950.1 fimbria/pilus periplasmic chaperone [Burkholderia sp. Tr-20390]
MNILKSLKAFALIGAALSAHAHASVVISGTRIIFPAHEREVTIKITNEGKTPALIQTWLDKGSANESPDKIDVPFILTPSMFRMEPGKGQTLRLIYSKEPLPADKESLFWLNVLEIPPKAAANDDRNKVQMAFRSRIKVMFRPDGLPGSAATAHKQVKWEVVREQGKYALKATNPTPYVVNFGSVALTSGDTKYDARMGFVLPGSTKLFPIDGLTFVPAGDAKVDFSTIDDWGASRDGQQPVSDHE